MEKVKSIQNKKQIRGGEFLRTNTSKTFSKSILPALNKILQDHKKYSEKIIKLDIDEIVNNYHTGRLDMIEIILDAVDKG